ncbi:hypothetical protein LTR94_024556 [Friedmanniomyces endolithicus]|nr:hypothetical protein LTR94_024556 [Friedmanniomyces endolithicus]
MSLLPALALLALAQDPNFSDGLDAVAAAPAHHRILLENDQVRVLEVTVGPGETEPVHSHRWPSVMHIQTPQPLTDIVYEVRNGAPVEVRRYDLPDGSPPPALFGGPEGPHAIHNRGQAPFKALRIELKPHQP